MHVHLIIIDETNLPADVPSYLSSQGTLAERQDGYGSSESGSQHHFVQSSPIGGYFFQQRESSGKDLTDLCNSCVSGDSFQDNVLQNCSLRFHYFCSLTK